MIRIICIGSALQASDAAGPAVYARLVRVPAEPGLEVIDGGLAGLDLVRTVDGAKRVVFVDAVEGRAFDGRALDGSQPDGGEVELLDPGAVAALASGAFDHAAGLPYLLRVLPIVLDTTLPEIAIVGVRGAASSATLDTAAALALSVARQGLGARPWRVR